MQQLPVPIIELIELMLYLGSITYLLGAVFQGVVLYRNKKSFLIRFTLFFTFFIWALGLVPVDEMFLFLFLPALIPELVFSPLMLVLFGNKLR